MKINVWNGFDNSDDEHEEEESSYSIARSVVPEPLYIPVDKLGFSPGTSGACRRHL